MSEERREKALKLATDKKTEITNEEEKMTLEEQNISIEEQKDKEVENIPEEEKMTLEEILLDENEDIFIETMNRFRKYIEIDNPDLLEIFNADGFIFTKESFLNSKKVKPWFQAFLNHSD